MKVRYISVGYKDDRIKEYEADKKGKVGKIYIDEYISYGKHRPERDKMILELNKGDIVYCSSISNLVKDIKELKQILNKLDDKGVRVKIEKENIDTVKESYKSLIRIIESIEEMESKRLKGIKLESIERLKNTKENSGEVKTKSGKWFGREEKKVYDLPKDFQRQYHKMRMGYISKTEMAKVLNVGRTTLYRWLKIYEEQ